MARIQCKLCGEIIESESRHDMVWCKCGKCAIDGGNDYCRITGDAGTWGFVNEKELYELRKQCHELIDKDIVKKCERKRRYNRLCRKMKVTPEDAHFSKFNKEQLLKALELLKGGEI